MLFYLGMVLYVLVCFLLLGVVLLQQGKGGDIAAAFGGSSSQTAFGARAGATVLTRATAVLGTLFMVGAFLLTAAGRSAPGGSVVSGVEGPAAPAAPALPTGAPLPTTTPAAPGAGTTPPAGGTTGAPAAPATSTTPPAGPAGSGS
jgi:preprotein translocase subunit SecG